MTIQTFTAGQKLTATQMNTLQASDFNFTRNVRTESSYTFSMSDKGKLVESTNAGAATFVIPADSVVPFDIGDRIDVLLASDGSVTISGAVGVTIFAEGDLTTISSKWTKVVLIKRATDSWVMTGGGLSIQTVEIDDGAVTSAKIANGTIVNEDISASAAIALSKLTPGTSGQIIVANSSGVPTWVSETGDVTISDTGVAAISSLAIVNADINDSAAIEQNKIADSIIDTKTANYTLALTDKNKFIEMNVGSPNTVSIPTDASVNFPIGSQINITQYGTGKTQVIAVTPGTTSVRSTPGAFLRAQYSSATLIKRAANEWYLIGDLSTS
jgi:hypothetical protein